MAHLHHHMHLYTSRRHLLVTFGFLLAPFLFLILFAQVAHLAKATLLTDLLISTWRLAVAYVIAAAIGWLSAVLFYKGRAASVALPVFDVLQSFPTFAALPLAVLIWGATNFTVIVFLVWAVIWPIFFSVVSGLKLIKEEWSEAVSTYQRPGVERIVKFLWPASIPGLITGSIVGLGDGWEALIATEIVAHMQTGLGNFFQTYSSNNVITMFGIFGLLIFVFSINKVVWLPLLEWSHRTMEE